MSRWPHGKSNLNEVRSALGRMRGWNTMPQLLHQRTWPFDPVFVEHAVEVLARAKPPLARVSASYLERKLGIDYGSAGLLCDVLARTGLCDKSKRYAIVHLQWPPPADRSLVLRSSPPPLPSQRTPAQAEVDGAVDALARFLEQNPPPKS